MLRKTLAFSVLLTVAGTAVGAKANPDIIPVEIHGYGGWSYGRSDSDANQYLASSKAGEAGYLNMAVAFTAQSSEQVRLNAQVWWEKSPDEEWKSVVDFAFGEWRVSDALRLRAGQVKHPYGIYTEVYDVGTIRPLFWLPQSVYGPSGVVAEAYRGFGLTGSVYSESDWRLEYDLYGGEMCLEGRNIGAFFATDSETSADEVSAETEEDEEELRDLVGGRLIVTVPGSDVRLGFSAYTGRMKENDGGRHSSAGAHVDFLNDRWSFRSEYTYLWKSSVLDATNAYCELARYLNHSWQIAGRADYSDTRLDGIDAGELSALLEHLDLTVGLNYWFNTDFVVKFSSSWVDGNRFARPEDLTDAVEGQERNRKTRLASVGVQFAF